VSGRVGVGVSCDFSHQLLLVVALTRPVLRQKCGRAFWGLGIGSCDAVELVLAKTRSSPVRRQVVGWGVF
jgi:hypothetical protein